MNNNLAMAQESVVVPFPKKEQQAMKQDGFTPLPNFICDEGYLSALSGEAIKCLVLLNRHIKGFRDEDKSIGEALVMKLTGFKDKRTVRKNMADLAKFKLIKITKRLGKPTIYSLSFEDRIAPELVASNVSGSSKVVTSNVTTLVTSDVTTTSSIECHSVKEIYLKENINKEEEENAPQNSNSSSYSKPNPSAFLQFTEYHNTDLQNRSLKELCDVYPVSADFIAQAKSNHPDLTDDQITTELKKLGRWSLTSEKKTAQKWMVTWLNWLDKNTSEQNKTPAAPKNKTPAKKTTRFGNLAQEQQQAAERQIDGECHDV